MGTNYYASISCKCCGNTTTLHICKSLLTFEAYPADGDKFNPTSYDLVSWKAWKEFLLEEEWWRIEDEYDNSYTAEEFIAMVEAVDPERRRSRNEYFSKYDEPGRNWIDEDGIHFSSYSFS